MDVQLLTRSEIVCVIVLLCTLLCCFPAAVFQVSRFSAGPPSTDVTYKQLKQLLAGRTSVVIDVREPWELREYGIIPGSINVPSECLLKVYKAHKV